MIVLGLRTDKPQAELYLYQANKQLAELKWQAHRELAETLNTYIEKILNKSSISYKDLDGLAFYKGPGSFTGLRIGASVANALSYAQNIPIVATGGADWLGQAVKLLQDGKNDKIVAPDYGAPPRLTKPKK